MKIYKVISKEKGMNYLVTELHDGFDPEVNESRKHGIYVAMGLTFGDFFNEKEGIEKIKEQMVGHENCKLLNTSLYPENSKYYEITEYCEI